MFMDRTMAKFSIKDIETISGIKAHTIRIWEQRYNFIQPKRTDTNIRYYDDHDLRFILNVAVLNNYGIKISEIAKMPYHQIQEMVLLVSEKDSRQDSQIKALISSMISMDEDGFNRILNSNILKMGLEETMVNVVFPFLHQIGVLWLTGAIHPAHEHFITNLIRQKLFVAIDAQGVRQIRENEVGFLLFLPEGENHEIGLLFANYVLRARGKKVFYLGPNLPHEELAKVYEMYKPKFVFTSITSTYSGQETQPFIDHLSQAWPHSTILITGYQVVSNQGLKIPTNVKVVHDMTHLLSLLEEMQHA